LEKHFIFSITLLCFQLQRLIYGNSWRILNKIKNQLNWKPNLICFDSKLELNRWNLRWLGLNLGFYFKNQRIDASDRHISWKNFIPPLKISFSPWKSSGNVSQTFFSVNFAEIYNRQIFRTCFLKFFAF
jgi:hypothetical protein